MISSKETMSGTHGQNLIASQPRTHKKETTTRTRDHDVSIGHKRQRDEPQPQEQTHEALAPKNKTCQCGSRVSDTEVIHSSWTLGTGLRVILCSNCSGE
jgi:hypothetical protein